MARENSSIKSSLIWSPLLLSALNASGCSLEAPEHCQSDLVALSTPGPKNGTSWVGQMWLSMTDQNL